MQSKRHFLALDGLRGVAALAVALGHLASVFGLPVGYGNTALAVDFFFMLSGFVLAYAYGERLAAGMKFKDYLIARIIRLYPLIVLATLLAATPLAAKIVLSPDNHVSGMVLARLTVQGSLLWPEWSRNPIDRSFLPLNPPAWSLFFEMVASALFGIGVWRGRLIYSCAVWLVSLLGILLVVANGTFDTGYEPGNAYLGFARVTFGFGTGVLLYRLWDRHQIALPRVLFVVLAISLPAWLLSPLNAVYWQLLFVALFAPLLIIAGASHEYPSLRALFHRSAELSYPLYILHWPIYGWVKSAVGLVKLSMHGVVLGTTAFLIAVSASRIILKLYDEPLRRSLTTWDRKRRAKHDRVGAVSTS